MSYKYQNVSKMEQSLVGYGTVKSNEAIVCDEAIENPNFKYLGEQSSDNAITSIAEPQENAVTEATFIEPTELKES